MAVRTLVIVGAGGHARELAWLVDDINRGSETFRFLGFVVSDLRRASGHDSPVLGDFDWLDANRSIVDAVAIGIGSPAARLAVADRLADEFGSFETPALIHPTAQFDVASTSIDRGAAICAGAIATVNVAIGSFASIGVSVTIGHESRIGKGCVVNPGANISGGVTLGEGVLVGTGAQILQYLTIGERASVGAGAVVVKDIAEGTTVVGIPARPIGK
jgi:sugar O-acyltransferase (sialic acid O-acetyltransferase NeuD family)